MAMAASDLLTIPETASILRLQVSTIRAWLLQRKLPHVKLGRRVFLRRGDTDLLIEAGIVPGKPSALCDATRSNRGVGKESGPREA